MARAVNRLIQSPSFSRRHPQWSGLFLVLDPRADLPFFAGVRFRDGRCLLVVDFELFNTTDSRTMTVAGTMSSLSLYGILAVIGAAWGELQMKHCAVEHLAGHFCVIFTDGCGRLGGAKHRQK